MATLPTLSENWIDRALGVLAPRWALSRTRARVASALVKRHYEAASLGRRTDGWRLSKGSADSVVGVDLARIRDVARDFVRNSSDGRGAVRTIGNHVVGWGIVAKSTPTAPTVDERWRAWANTTACDADGRRNLAGLQKLVIRTVATDGEVLIRRRWRRLSDGLPIPLQLQVLEADFLDTNRTRLLENGNRIINGIEYDAIGNRTAYWLFAEHPGSSFLPGGSLLSPSRRIPASEILHVFEGDRPGQNRAVSWFAPLLLPAKDLDEYIDAQLMKQKIAACLSVVTSDVDGTAAPIGTADDTSSPGVDQLSPGAVINVPPGREVTTVSPPSVQDFEPYVTTNQRRNAKGLGLSYEDYTGDYSRVNFSSARMARLEHYENVHDWRWLLLIPQFCDPVWGWAMEALTIAGVLTGAAPAAEWTAPPMPMIEPDKEGLSYQRLIRNGIMSLYEVLRERGYDPEAVLQEHARANKQIDALGLVLDSDPRKMTQAGQEQGGSGSKASAAVASATATDGGTV